MNACGRGHQKIYERAAAHGAQPSPFLGHRAIDSDEAVRMIDDQAGKPMLEGCCPSRIASPGLLDTPTDLADHQNTHRKVLVIHGRQPRRDARMAGRSLPELGDDVGVEQINQMRTARVRWRIRAKSRSVPAKGIERSASLNVCRLRRGRSVLTRISRCSASTERPWRAARTRSAATMRGSRFRTISCEGLAAAAFFAIVLSTIA